MFSLLVDMSFDSNETLLVLSELLNEVEFALEGNIEYNDPNEMLEYSTLSS
jgi:hypothetical protein